MSGLFPLLHFAGSGMPLDIFGDMKTSFGATLGVSADTGGYVLGFFIILVILIIFALIFGQEHTIVVAVGGLAAFAFVSLIQWFPWWCAILAFMALAVMLVRLPIFSSSGG